MTASSAGTFAAMARGMLGRNIVTMVSPVTEEQAWSSRPASRACATACRRFVASSFRKMWLRYAFTVPGAM